MSDSSEQSYYEIALTNRQVLISFVVLLTCVLAAFVSGVWLGQKGSAGAPEEEGQIAAADTEPSDLAQLEEFKMLSERQEDGELQEIVTEPGKGTTLGEDAGSSKKRSSPPPPRQASPPPPRQASPPPPAPPPATSSRTPAREGFVIQVFSTRDEASAKKVLDQLRKGGYPAFLSPVQVGAQVNHRVRIGPYSSRPPAEAAAEKVKAKYKLDTWITAASN